MCGEALGSEKDCMGELGFSLSIKGKRWLGHQGFGEIQLCTAWKMVLEFVSSPRSIVATSFGIQLWRVEEFGCDKKAQVEKDEGPEVEILLSILIVAEDLD